MENTVLETVGLSRNYRVGRDSVVALGGIDITIQKGEFVAIVGPSGCGKSTLLNLLGGLDQPTKGRVLLDGQNLTDLNENQLASLRRQKMGFIFQRHDLFPVLTARENIEFPLLLGGKSASERTQRANELLEEIGLLDKAEHLPDELSGGQQQRVGIARALANDPLILLADEPTGNLDSATSAEIINILIKLTREQRLTLVMVTHDSEVAMQADRKLTLRDGQLVKETKFQVEDQS
ncbi:MAG: ABC transporter ATP-binding protein [Anaerolinea sp.]|nr:ABC transporter ATP-binding protein [Anaerolinea sp.]